MPVPASQNRLAFISDVVPRHFGNGSAVYPHFLAQALRPRGIEFDVIIPDGTSVTRAPFLSGNDAAVAGWPRIGGVAISPSPSDWALYALRALRDQVSDLHHPNLDERARSASRIAGRRIIGGVLTRRKCARRKAITLALRGALKRFQGRNVMVNQPYWLAALESAELPGKRIIALTHDVVHKRVATYTRLGWPLDFPPLSREEEMALLDRADAIVAISHDDAELIREMLPKKEVVVAFPPIVGSFSTSGRRNLSSEGLKCVFVGGGAQHNRESLSFILNIWPAACAEIPGLTLEVVGGVGNAFGSVAPPPGVTLRGQVDDISAAYDDSDIALALVLDGTGVKMKILEAVGYGVPTVASHEAMRGLPGDAAAAFPLASSHETLIAILRRFADRPRELVGLAAAQANWAQRHLNRDRLISDLSDMLIHG